MIPALKPLAAFVAASAIPLVSLSPATAVDFDRLNFTVDCVLGETGEDDHVIADGEVVTVTLENCAGYYIRDHDNTTNVTMTTVGELDDNLDEIPAGLVTLTIEGHANLDINLTTDPEEDTEIFDIDIDVYVAAPINNPESTLLATEEMTLSLGAPETSIREEAIGTDGDDGSGDIYIGGLEMCEVNPGPHVYETLDITVTESGLYDFRAITVDPIDEDLNWGVPKYPSSDPFLALYTEFDPADPESNVVGCNDDGDETGYADIDDAWVINDEESYQGLVTEGGNILDRQFPWFRADLEAGEYTIVYMPFNAMGTADFNLGQYHESADNNDTWDPIAQSVTYEMWGPEGGLAIGHGLAATGVEPSLALWSGLALAGTGVAITVARRRAQRA